MPLIGTNVTGFLPGEIVNVPLAIPLTGGWPVGTHSLKAIVIQTVPGWLVDSSISEFIVL